MHRIRPEKAQAQAPGFCFPYTANSGARWSLLPERRGASARASTSLSMSASQEPQEADSS
jgi:hypothetical protein